MISVVWNETWVQFYHFPAENSLQKLLSENKK